MNNIVCHDHAYEFFRTIFRECVYSWPDGLAVIIGYASITCWLNVLFPQLWENYKNKSVESLSYGFLAIWFLGDITNLIGSILTGQQAFQIYLAWYFVLMDFATVGQCIYYNYFYAVTEFPEQETLLTGTNSNRNAKKNWGVTVISLIILALLIFNYKSYIRLDAPEMDYALIGSIISWICTVLYLGSRLPQILKNYTRKSVDGLSIHMFCFAFLGNFFYTVSIFLRCYNNFDLLLNSLPFLLGSGGTMWADGILFYQFKQYNKPPIVHKAHSSPEFPSYTDSPPESSHPVDFISNVSSHLNSSVESMFPLPASFYSSTPIPLHSHLNPLHKRNPSLR